MRFDLYPGKFNIFNGYAQDPIVNRLIDSLKPELILSLFKGSKVDICESREKKWTLFLGKSDSHLSDSLLTKKITKTLESSRDIYCIITLKKIREVDDDPLEFVIAILATKRISDFSPSRENIHENSNLKNLRSGILLHAKEKWID